MKNKKEILQEFLDSSLENVVRIEIRAGFLQNEYAKENKQALLQEMAQLESNKKETEKWVEYLKDQLTK